MVLAQLVSVSFAVALFQLALAFRDLPDGTLLQSAALRNGIDKSNGRILDVVEVEEQEEHSTTRTRTTRTQYSLEPPSSYPTLASRVLLWSLTLLSALSLFSRPTTSSKVLLLHSIPLILTLGRNHLHGLENLFEHLFLKPGKGDPQEEAIHASNAKVKSLLIPSRLFMVHAVAATLLKARTSLEILRIVWKHADIYDIRQVGSLTLAWKMLYPEAYHSHPAQTYMSNDVALLGIITALFILTDAPQIQRSLPHLCRGITSGRGYKMLKPWKVEALFLVLVIPVIGPSAAFGYWASLREQEIEIAEQADEGRYRSLAQNGEGLVVTVEEEVVTTLQQPSSSSSSSQTKGGGRGGKKRTENGKKTIKTSLFLGSGGHTTELLLLLSHLDAKRYTPRIYLVSSGDRFSKDKAEQLEETWGEGRGEWEVVEIPRAREVHQDWLTVPFSTLRSFWTCWKVTRPISSSTKEPFSDLLLMNGPGTCIPILFALHLHAFLLNPLYYLFFWKESNREEERIRPRTIYVESFARVKTLSLTARILKRGGMVDRFVRQWAVDEEGKDEDEDRRAERLSRNWLV